MAGKQLPQARTLNSGTGGGGSSTPSPAPRRLRQPRALVAASPPGAPRPDYGCAHPLRLQTPRASELPPHARGQVQPVLSSQRRTSQFLVSLSTRFLLRGLPRGSKGGGAPAGETRAAGLRLSGFWWLAYIPLANAYSYPENSSCLSTSMGFEGRAFEKRFLGLACVPGLR